MKIKTSFTLSTPCIKLVDILNQRIFSQIEALRSLVALVTKASTQRRVGEKDAFKILKNLVHGVLSLIGILFMSFQFVRSQNADLSIPREGLDTTVVTLNANNGGSNEVLSADFLKLNFGMFIHYNIAGDILVLMRTRKILSIKYYLLNVIRQLIRWKNR